MSPYMKAYEAGIELAKTEFFNKVSAYGNKGYANPKPKGPKKPKKKLKETKKVASPAQTKQVDPPARSNQQVKAPAQKRAPARARTEVVSKSSPRRSAPAQKRAPARARTEVVSKPSPRRPAVDMSIPEFKPFSLSSMGKSEAIQGSFGEEETRAPRVEARRRDPVIDTPDRIADRPSPILPSKREMDNPDFADPNRYVPAERASSPEPSFLDNVMGRVGDFASGVQDYFSSPQALRDFEDKQYGTSDAMDDAEFDSMNNAAMDAANQETAAKLKDIPGTAEYEARMEQEEADAIANRFDVQKGGYGRQLRRFRDQFGGRDAATKKLLEGINYRDFASALGNRGLRVGDQIDARQIIERLRAQQGLDGPVDTDNMGAIGIRDSRGQAVTRGALGRRRRPARAAEPRENTVEQPNMTDESPVLPSGTSDLTPAERGRLYGELGSLYAERDALFKQFGSGKRKLTPEEDAQLAKANKALEDYARMDKQIIPMYRSEGNKFRRMREAQRQRFGDAGPSRSTSKSVADTRKLLSNLGPASAPAGNASELLAKLQQRQGR